MADSSGTAPSKCESELGSLGLARKASLPGWRPGLRERAPVNNAVGGNYLWLLFAMPRSAPPGCRLLHEQGGWAEFTCLFHRLARGSGRGLQSRTLRGVGEASVHTPHGQVWTVRGYTSPARLSNWDSVMPC